MPERIHRRQEVGNQQVNFDVLLPDSVSLVGKVSVIYIYRQDDPTPLGNMNLAYFRRTDEELGIHPHVLVGDLFVEEEYRQNKVGTVLLGVLDIVAKKTGLNEFRGTIAAGVEIQQPWLIPFYEKHGFTVTKEGKTHKAVKIIE